MFTPIFLGLIVASTTGTLIPRVAMPVPPVIGRYASDVAWQSTDELVLSTNLGVHRYALRDRTTAQLISVAPLPTGLPDPEAVASDGVTVMTTGAITNGGYAMRLSDRKRRSAQRGTLLPLDVAVRGERVCLLAIAMKEKTNATVFCGALNEGWSKYTPVHRISSGQTIFPHSIQHLGGAIALADDGSLTVITSAEPGVFRYAPDGKLIERSGQSFDELVIPAMREIRTRFAGDVVGRYRLLLNTQPIAEDLVLTPRGPAIVVRIAEKERIRWELWWPRADGKAIPPTPLGIERIGPFGHLRCDARGTALACVGSSPSAKAASDFMAAEHAPRLWLFELPK